MLTFLRENLLSLPCKNPLAKYLKTLFMNFLFINSHPPNRLRKYRLPSPGRPFKRGPHLHIFDGEIRRKLTFGWQLEGRCACAGLVVFRLHAEIMDPSMFPEK